MKNILMSTLTMIFVSCTVMSFSALACGGDIDMTVPHIHDENGLLVAIENASTLNQRALKEIDIYQIFSGELALNQDVHSHANTALTSHKKHSYE